MKLRDIAIGSKLMAGFLIVVLIFGGVAAFQNLRMGELARPRDIGAGRTEDG